MTTDPGNLHRHLYRNLSVLRDIQRLLLQARHRQMHVIVFRDERGDVWRLERLSSRTTRTTTHYSEDMKPKRV
jgi:hypothetical protein